MKLISSPIKDFLEEIKKRPFAEVVTAKKVLEQKYMEGELYYKKIVNLTNKLTKIPIKTKQQTEDLNRAEELQQELIIMLQTIEDRATICNEICKEQRPDVFKK